MDAPNAVLVVDKKDEQDIAIAELFNPIYDSDKKILKYDVTPINSTFIELQQEFGQSILIVDITPDGKHVY